LPGEVRHVFRHTPPLVAPPQRRFLLPAYSVKEAARLAQTTSPTVSRWHHGYGPSYARAATKVLHGRELGAPLSYLQLVEVAFVATLRGMGITLKRIRAAHGYLMRRFDVEYPFAQLRLQTEGTHILKALKVEEGRWVEMLVVVSADGQLAWKEMIADRLREFVYGRHGWAVRWYPRGRDVPIMVDPLIAFGAPILVKSGVPTAVLRERFEAGEPEEEISEDFGVSQAHLRVALNFEGIPLAA